MRTARRRFQASGSFPLLCAGILAAAGAWHVRSEAAPLTPPVHGSAGAALPPALARDPIPQILLNPLPTTGAVPRMAPPASPPTAGELVRREKFTAQFQALKARHFGAHRGTIRQAGIDELKAFTDPQALLPMWTVLKNEKDDVRLAVLDHLAVQGDAGQAALATIAIRDKHSAIRAEATRRIAQPPVQRVLQVLDEALRSNEHEVVNNAGMLAGAIHAIEALPALIFAQFAQDRQETQGDLGWIAFGTTRSYVQDLVPVVGDNSGAFNPIIGQVIEGVVMRVADCIVTTYRGDVHHSLVSMSSYDWGRDTSHLAWNMPAWARWFNEEYVPFKRRQAQEQARAAGNGVSGNGTGTPGNPAGEGRPSDRSGGGRIKLP